MPNQSFTGTGWHSWNVPKGVKSVTVDVQGGGSAGSGGRGSGRVTGDMNVNDNDVLWVFVGGSGTASSGSTGGTGGAGNGGRGGDGHGGFNGGDGGGGATYIRMNSKTGPIKAVAGGAGGNSGDSGTGGKGGADVGESGHRGTSGGDPTGVATGGTQNQGGNGGTSSDSDNNHNYDGADALNGALSSGGRGGEVTVRCHGGGGGGGGYHGGGGGQASNPSYAPGGGGAGGSNFDGGLASVATNSQGGGGTGDGSVTLTWVTPAAANNPPTPPSSVTLNGATVTNGMPTRITGAPTIKATVNDPDTGDTIRLVLYFSTSSNFANAHGPRYSDTNKPYTASGKVASVDMPDLAQNTHYYVRLWSEDDHGKRSTNYNAFDFYTNQAGLPDSLRTNGGASGVTVNTIDTVTLSWQFNDPDPADLQRGFNLRYRTSITATVGAGAWVTINQPETADNTNPGAGPPSHSTNQWVFNPGTFKGNTFYEWQVQTRDLGGQWSEWSLLTRFFAASTSTPPLVKSPVNDVAVDVTVDETFTWQFRDPDPHDSQSRADLRYRLAATDATGDQSGNWTQLNGDPTTPGTSQSWTIPANTFLPKYEYEWQVRTYDAASNVSDWSDSGFFWGMGTPGAAGLPDVIPDLTTPQETLGCGEYAVFVYEQGGMHRIGEVTPILTLSFGRVRDDISVCLIETNGLGDCCDFYGTLRSWMHELVVFRNGVRVWEGPITRIGYYVDHVEIEAKDVMAYVYRRIMRQGYNDTFQIIERSPTGQITQVAPKRSVVERAQMIVCNALAPYDPNVLPYLTTVTGTNDASSHEWVPDWSVTAWEQIDSLAATGGLDYTVVGRRIVMWDTHVPIGKLPALTDGDFTDSPVVTEYGMDLATYLAVTDGNGNAGAAQIGNPSRPPGTSIDYPFGPIEMLASSYSSSATAPGTTDTLTPDAVQALVADMSSQARSSLADRFPSPLIVRIPDNSTLSQNCHLGFQQLVPGVWMPLRSSGTCRMVTQWQKLDSVSVDVDNAGEKVTVVLSPAPYQGLDPTIGTDDTSG